jgi:hypothetical protein
MPTWPSLYLLASHKSVFVLPNPYFLQLMKTSREGEAGERQLRESKEPLACEVRVPKTGKQLQFQRVPGADVGHLPHDKKKILGG